MDLPIRTLDQAIPNVLNEARAKEATRNVGRVAGRGHANGEPHERGVVIESVRLVSLIRDRSPTLLEDPRLALEPVADDRQSGRVGTRLRVLASSVATREETGKP